MFTYKSLFGRCGRNIESGPSLNQGSPQQVEVREALVLDNHFAWIVARCHFVRDRHVWLLRPRYAVLLVLRVHWNPWQLAQVSVIHVEVALRLRIWMSKSFSKRWRILLLLVLNKSRWINWELFLVCRCRLISYLRLCLRICNWLERS